MATSKEDGNDTDEEEEEEELVCANQGVPLEVSFSTPSTTEELQPLPTVLNDGFESTSCQGHSGTTSTKPPVRKMNMDIVQGGNRSPQRMPGYLFRLDVDNPLKDTSTSSAVIKQQLENNRNVLQQVSESNEDNAHEDEPNVFTLFPGLANHYPRQSDVIDRRMSTTEVTRTLAQMHAKADFSHMKQASRLIPPQRIWLDSLTEVLDEPPDVEEDSDSDHESEVEVTMSDGDDKD